MKVKNLFAFWTYSSFPYVLGAPIDEMDEEGRVQAPSFGTGYWFRPIKIVPVAKGEKLMAQLEQLGEEEREAQSVLRQEFLGKVKELVPFLEKK